MTNYPFNTGLVVLTGKYDITNVTNGHFNRPFVYMQ